LTPQRGCWGKFQKGKITIEPLHPSEKVERPEVVKRIQEILKPQKEGESSNTFYLTFGEIGTGKSVAIRDAVSGLEEPRCCLLQG